MRDRRVRGEGGDKGEEEGEEESAERRAGSTETR